MANIASAKSRIRRNEARRVINRNRVSKIRTFAKKVELAIQSGDQKAAQEALREAQPEIQRGVTKGIMHKNTAARKISRLAQRIEAMSETK